MRYFTVKSTGSRGARKYTVILGVPQSSKHLYFNGEMTVFQILYFYSKKYWQLGRL